MVLALKTVRAARMRMRMRPCADNPRPRRSKGGFMAWQPEPPFSISLLSPGLPIPLHSPGRPAVNHSPRGVSALRWSNSVTAVWSPSNLESGGPRNFFGRSVGRGFPRSLKWGSGVFAVAKSKFGPYYPQNWPLRDHRCNILGPHQGGDRWRFQQIHTSCCVVRGASQPHAIVPHR